MVQNPPLHANYVRLLYNPLCSVIHSDDQLPPDLWNVGYITFISTYTVFPSGLTANNKHFLLILYSRSSVQIKL